MPKQPESGPLAYFELQGADDTRIRFTLSPNRTSVVVSIRPRKGPVSIVILDAGEFDRLSGLVSGLREKMA